MEGRRTTWPSLENFSLFIKFRLLSIHSNMKKKKNQVIKLRQHPHHKEPNTGGNQEKKQIFSALFWSDHRTKDHAVQRQR